MSTQSDPFEVSKAANPFKAKPALKQIKGMKVTKVPGAPQTGAFSARLKDAKAREAAVGRTGISTPRDTKPGLNAHAAARQLQRNSGAPTTASVVNRQKFGKAADPFELAKAESTTSRKVTAAAFPGYHGAIAGKKGKKLRAFGNEYGRAFGGGLVGQAGGGLAGAALTRGKSGGALGGAIAGGLAGSTAGAVRGNNVNQRKGYLKGRG